MAEEIVRERPAKATILFDDLEAFWDEVEERLKLVDRQEVRISYFSEPFIPGLSFQNVYILVTCLCDGYLLSWKGLDKGQFTIHPTSFQEKDYETTKSVLEQAAKLGLFVKPGKLEAVFKR